MAPASEMPLPDKSNSLILVFVRNDSDINATSCSVFIKLLTRKGRRYEDDRERGGKEREEEYQGTFSVVERASGGSGFRDSNDIFQDGFHPV